MQCLSCLGEYDDPQADGSRYFHACPPLTRIKIRHADGREELVSNRLLPIDVAEAARGAGAELTFAPPLPLGAEFVEEVFIERPDARDENLIEDPEARGKWVARRQGKGSRRIR